jgi:hypothetical protein
MLPPSAGGDRPGDVRRRIFLREYPLVNVAQDRNFNGNLVVLV